MIGPKDRIRQSLGALLLNYVGAPANENTLLSLERGDRLTIV
jgi:hypothetical protein